MLAPARRSFRVPSSGWAVAVAALLAVALGALPARADARPLVGVGEQDPGMFTDRHWTDLGLPHVRLLVGWDALESRWQREEIDAYMAAARSAGARVLVAFSRSRLEWRERVLPSPDRYVRSFIRFRERYPDVTEFIPWNEANHGSQPTAKRPDMAAAYFDEMSWACPTCTIVAADVLDQSDMAKWLRAFRRAAIHRPRIWGLHNYIDANRFRTKGTRTLLRTVRGQIWFTETGGIVKRKHRQGRPRVTLPESPEHAARAVRWVFRLARLSPRISRVYLYHWSALPSEADPTWDSALVDPHGRPRPAYGVLRSWVRTARSRS